MSLTTGGARPPHWWGSLFWTGASVALCIFGCALIAYVVVLNESVTDARVYFYFFEKLRESGLVGFLFWVYGETGKVEPGLYVLYGLLINRVESFYVFSAANVFFSSVLFLVFSRILLRQAVGSSQAASRAAFFALVMYFFWYPSYANVLWAWRSQAAIIVALVSFLLLLAGRKRIGAIVATFSISFHYAAAPLLVVLLFLRFIVDLSPRLSDGVIALLSAGVGLVAGVVALELKEHFVVQSSEWIDGSAASAFVFSYVAASLAIIFVGRKFFAIKVVSDQQRPHGWLDRALRAFLALSCFMLGVAVFNNSHQDIMRIMQPVFVFMPVVFVALMQKIDIVGRLAAGGGLLVGSLPAVLSIAGYLSGPG